MNTPSHVAAAPRNIPIINPANMANLHVRNSVALMRLRLRVKMGAESQRSLRGLVTTWLPVVSERRPRRLVCRGSSEERGSLFTDVPWAQEHPARGALH
jgi:hypothetical protein